LEFGYVPGGSLDTYHNLSTFENTQILCQLLSALEYLHNRQPSIAHRDIKPENILVVQRDPDGICVKFADFGLSKEGDALKTFCGTPLYAAPELYLKAADRKGTADDVYGVAVDIWSLGVTVASLECRLPAYKQGWERDAFAWIHAVQKHVADHFKQHGGELLRLLLDKMLIEKPDERSSADHCHDEAQKLLQRLAGTRSQELDDGNDSSATPKPSMPITRSAVESKRADSAGSTIRPDTQSTSSDGSETPTRASPTEETGDSIRSSFIAALAYRDESLIDSLVNPTEFEEWQRSEASGAGVEELGQSKRKRTRPADKSPSSLSDPSADTSNRDRKERPESPNHKRSKRGE
jgi:serine/threonine protein kinase